MPNFVNPYVKATEDLIGPFIYNQIEILNSENLIERGPYELDNKAIY